MAKTMKAVQVAKPGADFEVVERDIPTPGRGQVRVRVQACGICHGDVVGKEGHFPGLKYPRIIGHEVAGVIDAVGEGVTAWREGQRVGVGWHGGHCFTCEACRAGDFINCSNSPTTGLAFDGGYAEYMVAPQDALAALPDGLTAEEAAPLMCAGVTTFNALRNSGARPGDVVAVQGIGGLGHLGVQYARRCGFETVAISSGADKRELALQLGAHHYVDAKAGAPEEVLRKLGGARVILATAPNAQAVSRLVGGLGRNGTLLVVAAPHDPLQVSVMSLIPGRRGVQGWASGTAKDSEDTLRFSALTGVKPMVEVLPLEKVSEGFQRMMSNQARFRVVLRPGAGS